MADIKTEHKRITGLDVYRVIACFFVISHHCNNKVLMQVEPKSLAWFLLVAYFFISKTAVQGFLMISGFNLLHREDEPAKSRSRVLRILGVLVVFSLIYYVWQAAFGYAGLSFKDAEGTFIGVPAVIASFFKMLISTPVTDSYWYLYMYLGLMLVMPFLQKLAKNMKGRDFALFFALAFVFAFAVPTLEVLIPGFSLESDFVLPAVTMSVTYLFLGHFAYLITKGQIELPGWMDRLMNGIRGNLLLCAGFCIFLALNLVISCSEFARTGGESYLSVGEIDCLPLALESVCLFALLLRIGYGKKITKLVEFIAPLTFGMYLLSDMMCTATHYLYYYLCQYMNRLFAVTIQSIAAFVLCAAAVFVLRLIPFVKKFI